MKQTAVEWLVEHLMLNEQVPHYNQLMIYKAKEMEKEQIIKHSLELAKILISNPYERSGKMPTELVEQYYNETFKSE